MDEEFPTSPPKRRRTESPVEAAMDAPPPTIPGLNLTKPATSDEGANDFTSEQAANTAVDVKGTPREISADAGPDLLNMLMMQVEAQARDQGQQPQVEPAVENVTEWKQQEARELARELSEPVQADDTKAEGPGVGTAGLVDEKAAPWAKVAQNLRTEQEDKMAGLEPSLGFENPFGSNYPQEFPDGPQPQPSSREADATTDLNTVKQEPLDQEPHLNGTETVTTDPPPTSDTLVPPSAEREWETDSSPYSSSTDSSSDSSDEDSDDDGDNDYALLSPTEQARILMDEVGSDDEGNKSKATGGTVKTANEKIEEVIPKPEIAITPEMRVEELGFVEAVVESTVLIKGKTTGEYQVLESGSLLCLKDRSVLGVVADTMGRVEQPLYTVRFTNDEAIAEAGVADKGTAIYYVHEHSTFVFTQPLKGLKGSDASNFHDEEVGDEEMEFSDDEKEAEHRRILKLRKRGIDVDTMGGRGGRGGVRGGMQGRGGRGGGRGRGRGGFQPSFLSHPENDLPGVNEAVGLNYDEGEYKPLRRPGTMESQEAPQQNGHQSPEQQQQEYPPPRFQQHNNRRNDHQRGRGANNRGRGNRGNFQQNRNQPHNSHQHQQQQQQQQQQQVYGFNQQQQQPQAWMPPVSPPPGMPNFNPGMMPGNASFNLNQQPNGYSQPFGQQSYGQQNYTQQSGYGQQNQAFSGAWANNQAAAEQVQRQLEELRRHAQGGPNYG